MLCVFWMEIHNAGTSWLYGIGEAGSTATSAGLCRETCKCCFRYAVMWSLPTRCSPPFQLHSEHLCRQPYQTAAQPSAKWLVGCAFNARVSVVIARPGHVYGTAVHYSSSYPKDAVGGR